MKYRNLKKEVDILKTENSFLKNHSVFCKNDLEKLNENLDNVTKSLTDVKVEVRYLTITLFDTNDRYREMGKLVQYFNVSTENVKSEIADNDQKQSASLLELKTQHIKTIGKYIYLSVWNTLVKNCSSLALIFFLQLKAYKTMNA